MRTTGSILQLGCGIALILLWALFSGGGGCAPRQVVTTYVLDSHATARHPPVTGASNQVLLVAEPQAAAGFDTPRIAYTKTPFTLEYYTQSNWVDTPARMLVPLLVDAMERSKGFDVVLPQPTSVNGDLRLETSIIRLQQEFQPAAPSRVKLTVRAKLIDIPTDHVLGTQLFEIVEPAPSEDAYGGVQAANKAVQRLLGEIQDFTLRYAPEKSKFGQGLPAAAMIAVNVIGVPAVVPGLVKPAVMTGPVARPAAVAKPLPAQPQPKPKRVAATTPKQGR
ncbi:MAG: ABC-type transport auxiliary lipoprotein family protein [Candidatus Competibacteraceae bacterium]